MPAKVEPDFFYAANQLFAPPKGDYQAMAAN